MQRRREKTQELGPSLGQGAKARLDTHGAKHFNLGRNTHDRGVEREQQQPGIVAGDASVFEGNLE